MCPLNSRRKGTKNFLIVQIYLQFLLFFFNFGIFSEQNKKNKKTCVLQAFSVVLPGLEPGFTA